MEIFEAVEAKQKFLFESACYCLKGLNSLIIIIIIIIIIVTVIT